jgi:hypothetical protein
MIATYDRITIQGVRLADIAENAEISDMFLRIH